WLELSNRIDEAPRGIRALRPYNQDVDRRRVRRALTAEELARLQEAAERGPERITRREGRGGKVLARISGPERAMLSRVAWETGFRANELRSLMPESFMLDGASPAVVVAAAFSKRRREDRLPIRREIAGRLGVFLAGRPRTEPAFPLPVAAGRMLRFDL